MTIPSKNSPLPTASSIRFYPLSSRAKRTMPTWLVLADLRICPTRAPGQPVLAPPALAARPSSGPIA
ncbi:hypothetical protein [Sorangium cellulosum]|uniref:hypothetical protein n=1 Tax=Sorangium cellulosum TaxID=56 RepID=UPI0012DB2167|nr:hypothetical protein [Sorangium cellulosum]